MNSTYDKNGKYPKTGEKAEKDLKFDILQEVRTMFNIRMDEVVNMIEKYATLVRTMELNQKEFENKMQQKYSIHNTRKDKVESILKDHIELIRKLYTQQQNTTNSVTELGKELHQRITDVQNDSQTKEKILSLEAKINSYDDCIKLF